MFALPVLTALAAFAPRAITVETATAAEPIRAGRVQAHLERQAAAWSAGGAGPEVRVVLEWPAPERLRVAVWADAGRMAEREIDGVGLDTLDEVSALSWFFVRSSIDRLLARRPAEDGRTSSAAAKVQVIPLEDTPPILEGEPAPPPAAEASPAEVVPVEQAPAAPLPDPEARTATASPAAPAPAAGRSEAFDREAMRLFFAPVSLGELGSVSLVLSSGGVVDGNGVSWGFGAAVRAELSRFVLGAGIMHRSLELGPSVEVGHTVLSGTIGVEPLPELPIELGLRLGLDVGQASAVGRSTLAASVLVGPYGRVRSPIVSLGTGEVAVFGELGLDVALLRNAYAGLDGVVYEESPLSLAACAGVEWRWR